MSNILIDVICENNIIKMDIEKVLLYMLSKLDIDYLSLEIEVLKAVAVLKRSFLSGYIKNFKYSYKDNKHLVIDDLNFKVENELLKRAVEETEGIIVIYKNSTVDLYYTECCGGATSNSEDVLGYKINYLRKILCHYCSENYSKKIVNMENIAKKLGKNISYSEGIGSIVKDVVRDDTGRIISANVLGNDMNSQDFVKLFEIEGSRAYFLEQSIAVKVIGKGLGLGICLEGAYNMAKMGYGYKDIINYYYTGVEYEKLCYDDILNTLKERKIIIDPGHGGLDKGNEINGILEKDVNFIISKHLKDLLEKKSANVILTRYDDEDVPLSERVKIINNERPDFYISIHQNSFFSKGINGVEVYCYSENDYDSKHLGALICSSISKNLDTINRGVKFGNYYLLREAKLNGVLVECMYMSGDKDSMKYIDENYLTIAKCIYESICTFYNIEP